MKPIRQEHKISDAAGVPIDARIERRSGQVMIVKVFHAAADYVSIARNNKLNEMSSDRFLTNCAEVEIVHERLRYIE